VGQIAQVTSHRSRKLFHKTPFSFAFGKKNPQAIERRSPAGVPKLKDQAAGLNDIVGIGGSVSFLCIASGFSFGTPGFYNKRVRSRRITANFRNDFLVKLLAAFPPLSIVPIGFDGEDPAVKTGENKRERKKCRGPSPVVIEPMPA
jgi:hypothetical protein